MEGKDNIKDFFSEKLGNYEAKVNPKLWGKVASQIGTTATVVGTGASVLTKWLIGLSISAVAITAATVVFNSSEVVTNEPVAEILEIKEEKLFVEAPIKKETQVLTDKNVVSTASVNEPVKTTIQPGSTRNKIVNPQVNQIDLSTPASEEQNDVIAIANEIVNTTAPKRSEEAAVKSEEGKETNALDINPIIEQASESLEPTFSITQYTNVFSPNGDRINDVFSLKSEGISDFYLIVINDRGESVFKSDDSNFEWNGRDLRSEPVPDGNYVYMLSGKDKDGNPIAQTRSLTILRSR